MFSLIYLSIYKILQLKGEKIDLYVNHISSINWHIECLTLKSETKSIRYGGKKKKKLSYGCTWRGEKTHHLVNETCQKICNTIKEQLEKRKKGKYIFYFPVIFILQTKWRTKGEKKRERERQLERWTSWIM